MAAIGLSTEQVAFVLQCSPSEVAVHYEAEFLHGLAVVTTEIATSLVRTAKAGDVSAQKYWLEVRAKWKAPVQVTLTAMLDADERRALLDTVLGLTNVTPPLPAIESKPPATHLAAPSREQ
jgi:hypothetical protein